MGENLDGTPHRHDPALLNAIRAVGELLAAEGETVRIVVVGGAALILGGLVTRLTEDVNIIAAVRSWRKGIPTGIAPPIRSRDHFFGRSRGWHGISTCRRTE
jgi:hypothetical protein